MALIELGDSPDARTSGVGVIVDLDDASMGFLRDAAIASLCWVENRVSRSVYVGSSSGDLPEYSTARFLRSSSQNQATPL